MVDSLVTALDFLRQGPALHAIKINHTNTFMTMRQGVVIELSTGFEIAANFYKNEVAGDAVCNHHVNGSIRISVAVIQPKPKSFSPDRFLWAERLPLCDQPSR